MRENGATQGNNALEDSESSFNWYAKHAEETRRYDRISDVALLVFGALIPATALITEPWSKTATVIIGVCVVVTTGMRRIYNWREAWIRFTGACVDLETAMMHYKYRIDTYDIEDQAERDKLLMARVRQIEEIESKSWMISNTPSSAEKQTGQ